MPDLKLNGVAIVPKTALPDVTGFTLDAVRMRLLREADAPKPVMVIGRLGFYEVPAMKRWAQKIRDRKAGRPPCVARYK